MCARVLKAYQQPLPLFTMLDYHFAMARTEIPLCSNRTQDNRQDFFEPADYV